MAVFLPAAAVGNGQVLITLGGAGEVMSYFYPRCDFAQNVHECMPCLYVGAPGHGVFHWTWGPEFSSHQSYVPDTNILRTELRLSTPPLILAFEDFCPPGENAFVRIITCENQGAHAFTGLFMHYFDLNLGEVPGKQAVRYHYDEGYVLQYFRDIVFSAGGTIPDMWRCGKAWGEHPQSAKSDLYDGHLNGQSEDIGEVNFALGWRLSVPPGERQRIELLICAGTAPDRKAEVLPRLKAIGVPKLREMAEQSDLEFVARRTQVVVSERLQSAYKRALLSLRLLGDVNSGSFLAAPEFDPAYERCGGYGYCWPRDASEATLALRLAGYEEYLKRLAHWYARVQLSDGMWGQRYWADGPVAASWSLREDFLQIDQSAAALLAIAVRLEDAPSEWDALWPALSRSAAALTARVDPAGWHRPACDLWETYCGVFAYSNASVSVALAHAAGVAAANGQSALAAEWEEKARQVRAATVASFNGAYFPRGMSADGAVDPVVDSSTLGLIVPFELLDLSDSAQRAMAEKHVATVEARLGVNWGGGRAMTRYEGDSYLGGAIGCVNTLWMAWALLRMARAWAREEPARATALRERAEAYVSVCLDHATPTGLLPELFGREPDTPYWAAPHSWASGLLVNIVHEIGVPQAGRKGV